MKIVSALAQEILNCDPACVTHQLLAGCFNNTGGRNNCRIKRDVAAIKFRRQCYRSKCCSELKRRSKLEEELYVFDL